jgi:DNA-binding MarR family transcriptional regulator
MSAAKTPRASKSRIRELADFRYALRRFLHFSEESATRVGLTPQQHQLLLQIAGAPAGTVTTVVYLAERLALRHHSVVELIHRCEEAGMVLRKGDPHDRRLVVLELTDAGSHTLQALSHDHATELNELGPVLIESLRTLTA